MYVSQIPMFLLMPWEETRKTVPDQNQLIVAWWWQMLYGNIKLGSGSGSGLLPDGTKP